jgi:ABC-type dipeptide/oligopeptide/nickel transport system ATPase subunit
VLADDRKVSTALAPKRLIRAKGMEFWTPLQLGEAVEKNPTGLQPALNGLREWARSRALEGSNLGQRDVNVIYIDLLKRLSRANEFPESLTELIAKLALQGQRSALFSRFGLTSEIDVNSIIDVISGTPPARQNVMAQVVKPYMDSNEARFAALDSLQQTLATFVDELNTAFFQNKEVGFDLGQGVKISSGGSPLDPKVLSSGEKQLLVLFCNVAQASNGQSIFIIDEPELSLNVSWQRRLIDALQKLASENAQFILATHSLELLSRHRSNVTKLVDRGSGQKAAPAETPGEEE